MHCPLCKAPDARQLPLRHTDSGTRYTLHECASCLVQFWDPLKNPGALWYENDTRYHGGDDHPLPANWNHKTTLSFLSPKKGTLLDVGCGKGGFLKYAQEKGWDVFGLDFDSKVATLSEALVGKGRVRTADIVAYAKETEHRFDLVTFFDVLEHIDNHHAFMEAVRALLSPEGYIAMSMPCRGMAPWLNPHDLPPRHLTRWNGEALRLFLARQGFSVHLVARVPASINYIVLKLRFRYGARFSFNLAGKVAAREAYTHKEQAIESGEEVRVSARPPRKVRIVLFLARLKDWVLFGIPACVIWLFLLPTERRYTTLFAIARKNSERVS